VGWWQALSYPHSLGGKSEVFGQRPGHLRTTLDRNNLAGLVLMAVVKWGDQVLAFSLNVNWLSVQDKDLADVCDNALTRRKA
jgi:hypothetical protein